LQRRGPRLYVPELGTLQPTFDRVIIASTVKEKDLWQALPIKDLKGAAHYFHIKSIADRSPWYASQIILTCTPFADPLWLLSLCDYALGFHVVSHVELAFDLPAASVEDARDKLEWLASRIRKRHQTRPGISIVSDDMNDPPEGCLNLPTLYYEDRSSTVNLKLYARQEKLLRGKFGNLCVRLEWSLSGAAIQRHLGGNQLDNLVDADLNGFLERQLCLEEVDLDRLDILLCGGRTKRRRTKKGKTRKPSRFPRTPTSAIFRHIGDISDTWSPDDHELVRRIRQTSPAHIRGVLRKIVKRVGRKCRVDQDRARRRNQLTPYRIDQCFKPVPLDRKGET